MWDFLFLRPVWMRSVTRSEKHLIGIFPFCLRLSPPLFKSNSGEPLNRVRCGNGIKFMLECGCPVVSPWCALPLCIRMKFCGAEMACLRCNAISDPVRRREATPLWRVTRRIKEDYLYIRLQSGRAPKAVNCPSLRQPGLIEQ